MSTSPTYPSGVNRSIPVVFAAAILLAACAQPGSTTSPSATATTTPSASAATSTSPMPTVPIADCAGLVDNTSAPVTAYEPGTTVYYMFACNDERVLVQAEIGAVEAGVVFVPLQSEYSFGKVTINKEVFSVTQEFTTLGRTDTVPLTFYGTFADLRSPTMVRVVGPTTDLSAFAAQDCADYKQMYNTTDCGMNDDASPRFLQEGAAAGWVNEFAN